jgi:cellulose synthase/poly-beta-1,6-N-acetylglucosamine synthase-like glycosyltransferase
LGQPYISVIVTAYNRRKYLSFALRSLEAQTLPRDRFEVIVVKNFEDKGYLSKGTLLKGSVYKRLPEDRLLRYAVHATGQHLQAF